MMCNDADMPRHILFVLFKKNRGGHDLVCGGWSDLAKKKGEIKNSTFL